MTDVREAGPSPYESIVARSERVAWRVDALLDATRPIDLTRRLLPESLAQVEPLRSLPPDDRLRLNQIRGNSYVHLFNFLEDSVIASVMRHASAAMFGDEAELRALLRFAEEEVKHQQLFRRFRASFDRDFPAPCRLLESAEEVAGFILDRSPLAVMFVTYHFELITQQHFLESVRDQSEALEPTFASMLEHHWLEEAQHTAIDALKIAELSDGATPASLDVAMSDYADIVAAFDGVLAQQVALDVETLADVASRPITTGELDGVRAAQHAACRRTFLLAGLRHPAFVRTIQKVVPDGVERLHAIAGRLDAPP